MPARSAQGRIARGFTLVEMLVALAIVALMGSMAWVGIDSLLRAQRGSQAHAEASAQLHIALRQWEVDLDAAVLPTGLEPMGWEGKVFRLTRAAAQAELGLVVVAWAVRNDGQQPHWMRWQSAPVTSVAQWRTAWAQGAQWGRSAGGATPQAVVLLPAHSMDIYEWSDGGWVNGLSTRSRRSGSRLSQAKPVQPDGLRLRLDTAQGELLKDWVSPTYGGARS